MSKALSYLINVITSKFPKHDAKKKKNFMYPDISQSMSDDICQKMGISNQTILYACYPAFLFDDKVYGAIITEFGIGISVREETRAPHFFYWKEIEGISAHKVNHFDNHDDTLTIHLKNSKHYTVDAYDFLTWDCKVSSIQIATDLTKCIELFNGLEESIEEFDCALNEGRLDDAENVANRMIAEDRNNQHGKKYYGYGFKGIVLKNRIILPLDDETRTSPLVKNAINNLEIALANINDNNENTLRFYEALSSLEESEKGRIYSIAAMSSEDNYMVALENYRIHTEHFLKDVNEHLKTEAQWQSELKEQYENENELAHAIQLKIRNAEQNSFVNRTKNAHASNLIYIVKDEYHLRGCFDPTATIRNVFTIDKLPNELKFPIGHPVANTLYMPHPMNNSLYIPYEGSEGNLFMDKIREFCRIVQCLGATRISYKSLKGQKISSEISKSIEANIGVGVNTHSVDCGFKYDTSSSENNGNNQSIDFLQEFNPLKAPYLPNNLVWYPAEVSWQQLAMQRLDGNLLHYEECINSKEITNISNSQKIEINAAFKNLIVNINTNYKSQYKESFSKEEESEWRIIIDFAPIEQINSNNRRPFEANYLSDVEREYQEELLFLMKDGEIDETGRRVLERLRDKLGLSKDRADFIENIFKSSKTVQ